MSDWGIPRGVAGRLVVTGTLRLVTPTSLGNGDMEGLTDMPLSLDALEGRPLLTGTSIAGALRNYLRTYEQGFRKREQARKPEQKQKEQQSYETQLFGGTKGDDDGAQSPLIVDDALGEVQRTEIRDGVKIDGTTRTAEAKKKYDLELLPAGTTFPLRFELLLPADPQLAQRQREALALALSGLERGEIAIGARKTRGFGRCVVDSWEVCAYDLREPSELLAWLSEGYSWNIPSPRITSGDAVTALGIEPLSIEDKRRLFTVTATFRLDSPVLIRSDASLISPEQLEALGDKEHEQQPDQIHLRSRRNGDEVAVVPGTSLAGVLRARAVRILNTLNEARTTSIVNELFGVETDDAGSRKSLRASRLIVEEAEIASGQPLVQNRVAIDRFTGGAFETALFSEAPHVGGTVELRLAIQDPCDFEIGLLLLLLKDLWTGDLPLGGTSSIGRGRLRGMMASLKHYHGAAWMITELADGSLSVSGGEASELERFVDALMKELNLNHGAC
ncbi:MAG: hypothetical protein KatS3mg057_2696 [Herpetosiphonaceae bacterium]|nr:MAG: hypothetical protein KatS3mg057_2696 [Herpetosiphonaceae bacterium]